MIGVKQFKSLRNSIEKIESGEISDNAFKRTIDQMKKSIDVLEAHIRRLYGREEELYHLYLSDGTYLTSIKGMVGLKKYLGVSEKAITSGLDRGSLVQGLFITTDKVNEVDLQKKHMHDACPFHRHKFVAYEYATLHADNLDFKDIEEERTEDKPRSVKSITRIKR